MGLVCITDTDEFWCAISDINGNFTICSITVSIDNRNVKLLLLMTYNIARLIVVVTIFKVNGLGRI